MTDLSHPYFGKQVILTSKHQKLELFKAPFRRILDASVEELPLDTDRLGTFSGEIERLDSPRETALKKALMGIEATGIPLGIASEGSIGTDPSLPWVQADYELAIFHDHETGLTISESKVSHQIIAATISVRIGQELEEFLTRADFPNHRLIVRPDSKELPIVFKGISDRDNLIQAIEKCASHSPTGLVRIESDFRAMHSPSRRANIRKVAELLAMRVASRCPECHCPGWGQVDFHKGVECSECHLFHESALRAEILGCYRCDYKEDGKVINQSIDPARCMYCNP